MLLLGSVNTCSFFLGDSNVPDFTLFDIHFCWAQTGRWYTCRISGGREYFHNGTRFIPGASITLFGHDLQLSLYRHWIA